MSERKIKNPQRSVLYRWLCIDLIFIILGIKSSLYFDINPFDGMILMVGITVILTSLFFIKLTLKNIKLIDDAIKHKKRIVHWQYTKEEWSEYISHEKSYRTTEGKLIAFVLSGITLIIFVPFILIIEEAKLSLFFVLLGLLGLYFFMGFVVPHIVFYFRKNTTGEVLVLEKGVLLNKQFHTWDFPLSKFNSAYFEKTPYPHLSISYDFVDRTGPRDYVIHIPIPKNNTTNIKSIVKQLK